MCVLLVFAKLVMVVRVWCRFVMVCWMVLTVSWRLFLSSCVVEWYRRGASVVSMVASMVSLSWWHSDSVCWDNFCHGKVPGLGCCRVMAAVMQTIVPQSLVFGWFISLMVDQVSFGCASGVHSSWTLVTGTKNPTNNAFTWLHIDSAQKQPIFVHCR